MKKGRVIVVIAALLAASLACVWSIYSRPFQETPCTQVPQDSVVFAPAFLSLGERDDKFIPGEANIQIASKLEACADQFSLVLTQKAVSDALVNPNALKNGTPVFQMHQHTPAIPVRTLAAFECALERFEDPSDRLVLIAQPKHHSRALMDLEALYGGEIVNLYLGDVLYQDHGSLRPFQWAAQNLGGWLGDRLLILSIQHPTVARLKPLLERWDVVGDCPAGVRLPKISKQNGRWVSKPD